MSSHVLYIPVEKIQYVLEPDRSRVITEVDTQSSSLDVDVIEFRFELGVEHDVVKTKHVVVKF